jgi:hypothetical protein
VSDLLLLNRARQRAKRDVRLTSPGELASGAAVGVGEDLPPVSRLLAETISASSLRKIGMVTAPCRVASVMLAVDSDVASSATDYWDVSLVQWSAVTRYDEARLVDTFTDIEAAEYPLPWRWWPPSDAANNLFIGSPEGGSLAPGSTSANTRTEYRRDFKQGDGKATAKFTAPVGTNNLSFGVVIKGVDADNGLYARLSLSSGSTQTLRIYKRVAGSDTQLATANLTNQLANGSHDVWVQLAIAGNDLTAKYFTGDPDTNSAENTVTYTLTGDDITAFGSGVTGYTGLRAVTNSDGAGLRVLEFRASSPRVKQPTPIITKSSGPPAGTSGVNGQFGEAMTANQRWTFEALDFDEDYRDLREGSILGVRFTKVGSPADLVNPLVTVGIVPQNEKPQIPARSAVTIQFIGDTHLAASDNFNRTYTRAQALLDDLASGACPVPHARLHVGDLVDIGDGRYDATAVPFIDQLPEDLNGNTGIDGLSVGNHDTTAGTGAQDRTGLEALVAYGFDEDSVNYTRTYGNVKVIILGIDHWPDDTVSKMVYESGTLTFLDDELSVADGAGQIAVVMAHAPLYGSVINRVAGPVIDNSTYTDSRSTGRFAQAADADTDSQSFLTILDDHPSAKMWVSGHTHSSIDDINIVGTLDIGTREIVTLNAGATHRTNPAVSPSNPVWTPWVTFHPDRIEVRFRNHGLGRWWGPDGQRVLSFDMPE